MRPLPRVLRFSRAQIERSDGLGALVSRRLCPPAAVAARVRAAYAFKNDERRFALELMRRRPQFWVFRSNQRAFCGDFVVVDMSDARADRRRVFVLDLKQGGRLRSGGGGCAQLRRSSQAVAELAGTGVAPCRFAQLTGDAGALLAYLCGTIDPDVA